MPQISVKGQQLPLSPIRKLTPYADAVKRSGVKVYHLNIGQPDLPSPKKALDALKAYDAETLSYTPSQGILPLRQALQRYYKRFGIDLALDEMIPSGWEIVNERLRGGSESNADNADLRDDRAIWYFGLGAGSSRTFKLKLRAAYEGKYVLPAIKCEAMYDPSISANTPSGSAAVVK